MGDNSATAAAFHGGAIRSNRNIGGLESQCRPI